MFGCGVWLPSTASPTAGCTKHLLRVGHCSFRSSDCKRFRLRPRIPARAIRRRFKASARPRWRSWAGESIPTGIVTGDAPPVGAVRRFRSTDGQPAVRDLAKAPILVRNSRPPCARVIKASRSGPLGVGVHLGIVGPTSRDGLQHAGNAPPLAASVRRHTERTGRFSHAASSLTGLVNFPGRPTDIALVWRSGVRLCRRATGQGIARPTAHQRVRWTPEVQPCLRRPPLVAGVYASKTHPAPLGRRRVLAADLLVCSGLLSAAPFQKRLASKAFFCFSM